MQPHNSQKGMRLTNSHTRLPILIRRSTPSYPSTSQLPRHAQPTRTPRRRAHEYAHRPLRRHSRRPRRRGSHRGDKTRGGRVSVWCGWVISCFCARLRVIVMLGRRRHRVRAGRVSEVVVRRFWGIYFRGSGVLLFLGFSVVSRVERRGFVVDAFGKLKK